MCPRGVRVGVVLSLMVPTAETRPLWKLPETGPACQGAQLAPIGRGRRNVMVGRRSRMAEGLIDHQQAEFSCSVHLEHTQISLQRVHQISPHGG